MDPFDTSCADARMEQWSIRLTFTPTNATNIPLGQIVHRDCVCVCVFDACVLVRLLRECLFLREHNISYIRAQRINQRFQDNCFTTQFFLEVFFLIISSLCYYCLTTHTQKMNTNARPSTQTTTSDMQCNTREHSGIVTATFSRLRL